MNQYFYLDANNAQQGPISPIHFTRYGITPDTLVWCNGMADWTRAGSLPELRSYLAQGGQSASSQTPPPPYGTQQTAYGAQPGSSRPEPSAAYAGGSTQQQMLPCPDTHMAKAILVTAFSFICCGVIGGITGIVAIVKASQVSNLYLRGDYDGSLLASADAKRWVNISLIIDLVILLISTTFYACVGLAGLAGL